jgi:hypothetical protein
MFCLNTLFIIIYILPSYSFILLPIINITHEIIIYDSMVLLKYEIMPLSILLNSQLVI